MRDDQLDVPLPTATPALQRRPASPQLLIEMPAEAATRLLIRSLLEQLSQMASPRSDDGWRIATHRVTECASLYAEPLAGSIPRKPRRRLRELASDAERVRRTDVQLAWLGRFLQAAPFAGANTLADSSDDIAAATWLSRRALRRQRSLGVTAKRAARDAAKLQSLAKSLGVYTTAVRLDDMPTPRSFAALTEGLLREEGERASKNVRDVRLLSMRSVRRALVSARRLGYLLEPVRIHLSGAALVCDQLSELQASLERMADLGAVASVILRAGRTAGALHMTSLLELELFGGSEGVSTRDQRPGLLVLARQLRGEVASAFEQFANQWSEQRIDGLFVDLDACTDQL